MTRAVAHFKTLCCLGLPKQAAMVAIAGALHDIIPSEWNRIGLFDESGQPGAGFAEHPGSVPLLLEHIDLFRGEDPILAGVIGQVLRRKVTGLLGGAYREAYMRSDWFNAVERPLDAYWLLDAIIEDGGRPIAGVVLIRPRGSKRFRLEEIALLDALRPWIAHALRDRPDPLSSFHEQDGRGQIAGPPVMRGTVVLDHEERVLFQTSGSDYLYAILSGMDETLRPALRTATPEAVQRVLHRLAATGRDDQASPPFLAMETPWGLVTVEAAWLNQPSGSSGGWSHTKGPFTAVTLELREHPAAYAARVLRANGASPSQVRVGILLALGKQHTEIARELSVQPSSVEDAARKLYARMQVNNAAALSTFIWLSSAEQR